MKKIVDTKNAPKAIGPYSQGVFAGDLLFLSGQIPIDPKTNALVEADIETQTRQVLSNIKAALTSENLTMGHLVKLVIYLADMNDFAAVNTVYAGFFKPPYPARVAVEVARLPKDALIEIEAIAYRGQ